MTNAISEIDRTLRFAPSCRRAVVVKSQLIAWPPATNCRSSSRSTRSRRRSAISKPSIPRSADVREQIRELRRQLNDTIRSIYKNLDPWETVRVARHPERPMFTDYVDLVFDEFVELHGDKFFGDDRALRTGFAKLDEYKVLLVGHQKGKTLKERNECFFGCAHPEGYRKAMEKMQLAAKYGLPIISLIDTPGAYPGIGAEERGQAQVIAESMLPMSRLPHADHLRRDRRRRLRRRPGHRRRRPRGRARVRLLLGDQPRRLRRHPVEKPRLRPAGGPGAEDHLDAICTSWASSTTSSRSRSAAPTATITRWAAG